MQKYKCFKFFLQFYVYYIINFPSRLSTPQLYGLLIMSITFWFVFQKNLTCEYDDSDDYYNENDENGDDNQDNSSEATCRYSGWRVSSQ